MTDDKITSRLHSLGEQPIDSATQSAHLTAMATSPIPTRSLRHKVQVAGALLAGLLIGGTGLASAGALPGGAQRAAHSTLAKVGVKVPPGHDRVTEGCEVDADGNPYKNHGQYVKAHPGDEAAAQSDCGKPKKSVHNDDTPDSEDEAKVCPSPDPTAAVNEQGNGKAKAKGADKAKAKAAKGCADGGSDDGAESDAAEPESNDTDPGPEASDGKGGRDSSSRPDQPDHSKGRSDNAPPSDTPVNP